MYNIYFCVYYAKSKSWHDSCKMQEKFKPYKTVFKAIQGLNGLYDKLYLESNKTRQKRKQSPVEPYDVLV